MRSSVVGTKVIARVDKCGVIQAGTVYEVESCIHPTLGDCGLIKLVGVRDYWNSQDFIPIKADKL